MLVEKMLAAMIVTVGRRLMEGSGADVDILAATTATVGRDKEEQWNGRCNRRRIVIASFHGRG